MMLFINPITLDNNELAKVLFTIRGFYIAINIYFVNYVYCFFKTPEYHIVHMKCAGSIKSAG